jgi:hypothetical protein
MTSLIYIPLVYALIQYAQDPELVFREQYWWYVFSPLTGVAMWFWSLWDWSTTQFTSRAQKLGWMIVIFAGFYLGSTLYFALVGLRPKQHATSNDAEVETGKVI